MVEGVSCLHIVVDARELLWTRGRLIARAVLVLELVSQRLARVEAVERAVERRRHAHAQRRGERGRRCVELEQRRERRLGRASTAEPHAGPAPPDDLPPGWGGGMAVRARGGVRPATPC